MKIQRLWAMPTSSTFDCAPIGQFVRRYLRKSSVSIDPFAGTKKWATWTNDLNPKMEAQYCMDAVEFLKMLKEKEVRADLVIFDPPYSPRQVKECYESVGLRMMQSDGWRTHSWNEPISLCDELLVTDGIFLYFGWNTVGMGKGRGYRIEEIVIVCHGAGHNDTLCMAERKMGDQLRLDM